MDAVRGEVVAGAEEAEEAEESAGWSKKNKKTPHNVGKKDLGAPDLVFQNVRPNRFFTAKWSMVVACLPDSNFHGCIWVCWPARRTIRLQIT